MTKNKELHDVTVWVFLFFNTFSKNIGISKI